MKRRQEGFTLVELLVVIAIIIILAAILFPVFVKARERAQQTKCINNLKQMGVACTMYQDDYDGMVLPFSVYTDSRVSETTWGFMWGDLMNPYLRQLTKKRPTAGEPVWGYDIREMGEIYICPSAPIEEMETGVQAAKTYGYNDYLRTSTTLEMIKYPSLTLRMTEGGTRNPDLPPGPDNKEQGGSWYAPYPHYVGFKRYAPGWHSDNNNVLWVDGHVSTMHYSRVMMQDNLRDERGRVGNVWVRLAPKPASIME